MEDVPDSNHTGQIDHDQRDNQNIEIRLLVEAIYMKYGYDFRNYTKAHVKRRVRHRLALSGLESISAMTHKMLYEPDFINTVLADLSINVTEMFRDPSFYQVVRKTLVPFLHTYPFTKVWHAGCATGEEVYSMTIVFKEEHLDQKVQIYATDFNQEVLEVAKSAIYPIKLIKEYTSNYQKSGGLRSFADYFTAQYDSVILDQALKEQIVFADHNLVTDEVFGEMNMIVCRNVLIYFNKELQERVIKLFYDSLCPGGFLCLGSKESLKFSKYYHHFEVISAQERIFRRKYDSHL